MKVIIGIFVLITAMTQHINAQELSLRHMQFTFDLIEDWHAQLGEKESKKVKQAYQDFVSLYAHDFPGETDNAMRSKAFKALAKLEGVEGETSANLPALPAVSQVEADTETAEGEDNEVKIHVDTMPKMLGGLGRLYKYLDYPEAAQKAGIQGRVLVQFVVDKNGRTRDHKVVKGIGFGCDEAAVDAIKRTKWEPGKIEGKPVHVQTALTIMFKLSE